MILTVTLNASIDKAYTVEGFKAGDVKRVKTAVYTAGGKGLNVARVINILGAPVLATGFVGGFAGRFIEQKLDEQKIPHSFVRIRGETRSCINIIDELTHVHTELLEPGPLVAPGDVERFIHRFRVLLGRSSVVTLSGSAPPGVNTDIYEVLISLVKKAGKKIILDASGEFLRTGVQASPTLIKPNIGEAEAFLGKAIHDRESMIAAVKDLLAMGPEKAAISMGGDGVILGESDSGRMFWARPPAITPVNTVGCGDAMVAGFAVAFHRGFATEDMVRFGVAVSAAAALTAETGSCRAEDVAGIMEKVQLTSL